jgi:hypothetical protein
MDEPTFLDLIIAARKIKKPKKYCVVILPGIYRYLRMTKYHHWRNKFLLWEATK